MIIVSGFAPLLALFKDFACMNLVMGTFKHIPGFPLEEIGILMFFSWDYCL
jgi:Zn-dependent protease